VTWSNYIGEGFLEAARLIFSLDREVIGISWVSLKCSGAAIFLATALGIPLGFIIGANNFAGKRVLITIFNTLMALPTVVVGLTLYSMFSSQGPLGPANLLYSQAAIIIGEFILAAPIVISLTISAVRSLEGRVKATAQTLGAGQWDTARAILWEARFALTAAVIAGYGRVIAELGVAMMLGGNIRGYTRTLTTAIALETSRGEFGLALALGFILLVLALGVNVMANALQRHAE
jgi:tungstate transport system permease protein